MDYNALMIMQETAIQNSNILTRTSDPNVSSKVMHDTAQNRKTLSEDQKQTYQQSDLDAWNDTEVLSKKCAYVWTNL